LQGRAERQHPFIELQVRYRAAHATAELRPAERFAQARDADWLERRVDSKRELLRSCTLHGERIELQRAVQERDARWREQLEVAAGTRELQRALAELEAIECAAGPGELRTRTIA